MSKQTREAPINMNQQKMEKVSDDVRGKKRKGDAVHAPLCLNPVRRPKSKWHNISNCDISDKDTRTTLLEEFCSTKKERLENARKGDGKIVHV